MSEEIKIISDENGDGAVAILPGEYVSYFRIELPDLPAVKLEKILPNIVADYIAGSIENAHISNLGAEEDDLSLIAVCDEKWLAKAKEAAIPFGKVLKAIWPDYALLERPQQGVVIDRKAGRAIGRCEDGTGFAIDEKFLDALIMDGSFLENSENINIPKGVGLATGKYSPRPPLFEYFKEVKRLGLIIAAVFVVWLIYITATISGYEEKRIQYADASVNAFKEKYPDVENIVNVEAQLRNLVQNNIQSGKESFLFFANNLFKAIKDTQGIKLDSLNYDSDVDGSILQITITSSGFSEVTTFETNLKSLGFVLEQGSSSQNGAEIYSDYRIREAIR